MYLCRENGVLICLDAKSGERYYQERTHSQRHRASPVYADGKLYITARDGVVNVVKTGRNFEVLATNELGEDVSASPIIADGTLYLRSFDALYAIRTDKRPEAAPASEDPATKTTTKKAAADETATDETPAGEPTSPPDGFPKGSLDRYVAPIANSNKPADAWNALEIDCRGSLIALRVNRRQVQDVDQAAVADVADVKGKALCLYVALPNHALPNHGLRNDGGAIDFRNVRREPLDAPREKSRSKE